MPDGGALAAADRPVWFENDDDAAGAMARERALKTWRRDRKGHPIEVQNARLGGSVPEGQASPGVWAQVRVKARGQRCDMTHRERQKGAERAIVSVSMRRTRRERFERQAGAVERRRHPRRGWRCLAGVRQRKNPPRISADGF
jgi:hypothetical protein